MKLSAIIALSWFCSSLTPAMRRPQSHRCMASLRTQVERNSGARVTLSDRDRSNSERLTDAWRVRL